MKTARAILAISILAGCVHDQERAGSPGGGAGGTGAFGASEGAVLVGGGSDQSAVGSGDPAGGGSAVSAGSGPGGSGGSQNAAPVILQASANPIVVESGQSVVLSVIATDPDGIADLIGGVVETPLGAAYASLISSADEGAYEVDLSWNELNLTEPIEIPPNALVQRDFKIVMFDQGGASAEATVSVSLEGAVQGWAVCNGTPADPLSQEHCGACDFSCLDDFGDSYGVGVCIQDSSLLFCKKTPHFFLAAADGNTTCEQKCAQVGPSVFSWFVTGCDVLGASCIVSLPDCAAASFQQIPGCVTGSTMVDCECTGYWESPGW